MIKSLQILNINVSLYQKSYDGRGNVIDSDKTSLLVNGHHLRLYHQLASKETFVNIFEESDLYVTTTGECSLVQHEI